MYNFVIFGSNWDLYKVSYSDVTAMDNVRYISEPYKNKFPLIKFLYRLHFSPKINRVVNLPFKKIWNSGYFANDLQNNNPICFVFFISSYSYGKKGLIEFLRNTYSDSKMVCFFQDLVSLQKYIDINHVKNVFDLVISYDSVEAKKYNISYHPTVYSKSFVAINKKLQKSDVYFLGAAKNRFDKIILIYQYLKRKGLRCEFYLTNVNLEDQLHYEGIHYISQMSYQENLEHIVRTECVLEVMQKNATGYTMRTWEAIMYDKKLLTNNIEIKKAPFFNELNISVFENTDDLESNHFFFEDFARKTDHQYKENISPVKLLEFIEKELQNKKQG